MSDIYAHLYIILILNCQVFMFKENIEQNLGSENQEQPKSEKENLWEEKRKEIEQTGDRLGYRVDDGIKESVITMNLLELPTHESCEGHSDRGISAPWVGIEAHGRPEERFIGEKEMFQRIADKYKVSLESVVNSDNFEAWSEAIIKVSDNGETEEYKKWRKENMPLVKRIKELLEEFYRDREVSDNIQLVVSMSAEGGFRIHNGGEDYRPAKNAWEKMNEEEKEALRERELIIIKRK